MKTTLAIIQARTCSTRLPNKVFAKLGHHSVLEWVVERTKQAECVDEVAVATGEGADNDPIALWCDSVGLRCFRGSDSDVLGRMTLAANHFGGNYIYRVNADNPFIDPAYFRPLLDHIVNGGAEYASYQTAASTPVMLTGIGFFVELVTRDCLVRASGELSARQEREHVTLGIYRRPDAYRVTFVTIPAWSQDDRLHFTLDTPADLVLLRELVEARRGCRAGDRGANRDSCAAASGLANANGNSQAGSGKTDALDVRKGRGGFLL